MRRLLAILTIIVATTLTSVGQDPHFSQYYSSELYLNPAMAGSDGALTFSSNYRTQWRSIVLPYVTSQMSIVSPVVVGTSHPKHIGGWGLSVYNDRAGDGNFKTMGVNASLSYLVTLKEEIDKGGSGIAFGLQGGIIQKNVDYTNLEWGEQFNPYIGFDATVTPSEAQLGTGTMYPDLSAGVIYYYNGAGDYNQTKMSGFVGASAYHLNTPNESFINTVTAALPMLYKVHGGVAFEVSPRIHLSPNVLGMLQNDVWHLNGGLYLTWKALQNASANDIIRNSEIVFGVWHRLRDSFIFSTGVTHSRYTFGFSYDFNSSSLRHQTQGRGAYEFSLAIRVKQEKKLKIIQTPRI